MWALKNQANPSWRSGSRQRLAPPLGFIICRVGLGVDEAELARVDKLHRDGARSYTAAVSESDTRVFRVGAETDLVVDRERVVGT